MAVSGRGSTDQLTVEFRAQRYNQGAVENETISPAKEIPYTLFVNDSEILSAATIPAHLEELFTGFLVSEGVMVSPEEIIECAVDHATKLVRFELRVLP